MKDSDTKRELNEQSTKRSFISRVDNTFERTGMRVG